MQEEIKLVSTLTYTHKALLMICDHFNIKTRLLAPNQSVRALNPSNRCVLRCLMAAFGSESIIISERRMTSLLGAIYAAIIIREYTPFELIITYPKEVYAYGKLHAILQPKANHPDF